MILERKIPRKSNVRLIVLPPCLSVVGSIYFRKYPLNGQEIQLYNDKILVQIFNWECLVTKIHFTTRLNNSICKEPFTYNMLFSYLLWAWQPEH